MKLGMIIHNYRKAQGVSMDLFCKKSGLSKGYISMLENERNPRSNKPIRPTLPTLEKLASAMDMSMTDLFELLDPDTVVDVSSKNVTSSPISAGGMGDVPMTVTVTEHEKDVLMGYRKAEEAIRNAIDDILHIEKKEKLSILEDRREA